MQENVAGMRVVKTFVREDYEDNKFSTASSNLSKDFIKAEKIVALMTPLMNTSIHVVYLLTMFFSTYIILEMAPGTLDANGDPIWGSFAPETMSALLTKMLF